MKKVAIASNYYLHNYGSMLQAYATQVALDKLGCENETIDISGLHGDIARAKRNYFIKASLSSSFLFHKFGMARAALTRKFVNNEYTRNAARRAQRFDAFSREHFALTQAFPSREALTRYCERNCGAVLVGSDQLWLPANIAADYFTLSFVPPSVNSIAYATSFGQSSLPKDIVPKAGEFLRNIRHIAVREEAGQKLVKELTGRSVPVVCDPVLLLTQAEWTEALRLEELKAEPYVFCYFLGRNHAHRGFARRLADETGCRVVILPHLDEHVKADEDCADAALYDVDPRDFLNLIRGARYVCTDSFHATAFSLLFGKQFFCLRRYGKTTALSTNSRLDTLLRYAGLGPQYMRGGDEDVRGCLDDVPDYDVTAAKLNGFREASYCYLKAALADEASTDL